MGNREKCQGYPVKKRKITTSHRPEEGKKPIGRYETLTRGNPNNQKKKGTASQRQTGKLKIGTLKAPHLKKGRPRR